MLECPFNSQLGAFYDRELDAQAAHQVSEHLAGCGACQEELAELRRVSGLFVAKSQAPMLPLELARLHQSLRQSDAVGAKARPEETDFLRTAGMLSALAASVLIISSVWLAEIPSRHAAILSPGIAVVPASDLSDLPDWERTALTLRVESTPFDPIPGNEEGSKFNQIGLANAESFGENSVDSQVADWMVAGLSAGGGHANP
jgi:anti-sigma factor RsiW